MVWKKPSINTLDAAALASQIVVKANSSYPTFKNIYLSGLWDGYRGYAQGNVEIGGEGRHWKYWYVNCFTSGASHRFRTPDHNNNMFKYLYPDKQSSLDDYAAWFDY